MYVVVLKKKKDPFWGWRDGIMVKSLAAFLEGPYWVPSTRVGSSHLPVTPDPEGAFRLPRIPSHIHTNKNKI